MFNLDVVHAHCDIPCKIYDPCVAQVATMSVIRLLHLLQDVDASNSSLANLAKISRLTTEKEKEATLVKSEVLIIWGDYFKEPQINTFPNIHEVVHSIMLCASKCKQEIEVENGLHLLKLINEFTDIFWRTKGFNTEPVKAPYPPALGMVRPILENAEAI